MYRSLWTPETACRAGEALGDVGLLVVHALGKGLILGAARWHSGDLGRGGAGGENDDDIGFFDPPSLFLFLLFFVHFDKITHDVFSRPCVPGRPRVYLLISLSCVFSLTGIKPACILELPRTF